MRVGPFSSVPRDSVASVTFLFAIAREKNQLPAHAAGPSNVCTPDCADTAGGPARVIAKCHGYDIWKNKSAEMLDRLMRFIGEAWLSFPWDKNKKMREKKRMKRETASRVDRRVNHQVVGSFILTLILYSLVIILITGTARVTHNWLFG